ncbi:MAG: glycosyltransferase family 2 protein [Ignavibacteriae bacterium]|nr:glycosyltransferase family 2 protein [Ignavibacteriota bacterium]
MSVSVIIISYNTAALTLKCIASVRATFSDCSIIVVDNCSPDDTVLQVQKNFPYVEIIVSSENKSYANAVNIGMHSCRTEYAVVTNADVEFRDSSISILTEYLTNHPRVGVVAPQQVYPNGSWQRSYGYVPGIKEGISDFLMITAAKHLLRTLCFHSFPIDKKPKHVDFVDGAILAIRISAYNSVNGFDEEFSFYTEESDFCYRLSKAKWDVVFNPKAIVMHIRGASSGAEMNLTEAKVRKLIYSKVQFIRKHCSSLEQKIYIFLEYLHFSMKMVLYKTARLFSHIPSIQTKVTFFERISSYWEEYL